MKQTLILMLCGVAGCTANPLRATSTVTPKHHNIPATMADAPEGPVYYLCATQPRQYTGPTGTTWEEDHYLQPAPCPATPIE